MNKKENIDWDRVKTALLLNNNKKFFKTEKITKIISIKNKSEGVVYLILTTFAIKFIANIEIIYYDCYTCKSDFGYLPNFLLDTNPYLFIIFGFIPGFIMMFGNKNILKYPIIKNFFMILFTILLLFSLFGVTAGINGIVRKIEQTTDY